MSVSEPELTRRRALATAVLAGLAVAVLSTAVIWTQALLTREFALSGPLLAGVLADGALSLVWHGSFLLAVLFVVGGGANRRTLTNGIALVYVAALLPAVAQAASGFGTLGPHVLVTPVPEGGLFLAVATAYWLAYEGGFDRLRTTLGNPSHPLFAVVSGERIAPGMTLGRGVVAAGLAGAVAVAAAVGAGVLSGVLRSAAESTVQVSFFTVGLPVAEAPTAWLFETALLLAVLLVVGPRARGRDLATGLAVIFGVGAGVRLAPALLPPFSGVDLWAPSGPVMAPLADAVLLIGIAVAVWLAFGGGIEYLDRRRPSAAGTPSE